MTITENVSVRAPGYGGTPLFGWWREQDGQVGGAFVQTPPRPVVAALSAGEATESLARALAGTRISGFNAEPGTAEAFAAAWGRRTGVGAQVVKRTRLYRLGRLVPPSPAPPGGARPARPDDRDLLLAWHEAFYRDVGEPSGDPAPAVDDRIGHGRLSLWEADGVPVSMAGSTRPVAGVVRIAPVYTPDELRGRGYGGAVTAAISRQALERGHEVVLFTDLANPTSNALYQRLGYRPVHDRVVVAFG
ncbi:GNAT family N-acetyltransferase [Actinomadura sp. NPDC047616]|uniref:GNAT family N-acetyltransferase n=1 Tax=Actinomadura sp. NPDC047616 TaxID=3155914 RepID=UPI0033E936F4